MPNFYRIKKMNSFKNKKQIFDKTLEYTRFLSGFIIKISNFATIFIIYLLEKVKTKSFKISLLTTVIFILLAIYLPKLLDNSALKFKIEQKISDITQSNFVINGDVEIKLVPYPVIIANDVNLYGLKKENKINGEIKYYDFFAKSITSRIPLFGISADNFTTKITIDNGILESYQGDLSDKNKKSPIKKAIENLPARESNKSNIDMKQGISSKIFDFTKVSGSNFDILKIPQIRFIDSTFVRYDNLLREKELKKINGVISFNNVEMRSEIDFISNEIKSKIRALINLKKRFGQRDSYIEILSSIASLRIELDFDKYDYEIMNSDFKGKFMAEISEFKSFYGSYINNYDIIFNKLNYNSKDIKISADIKSSSGELDIDNILLNSSIINGQGYANLSLRKQVPIIDIVIDLQNLDLDSIWSDKPLSLNKLQSYIKYRPSKITIDDQEKDDLTNKAKNIEAGDESKLISNNDPNIYQDDNNKEANNNSEKEQLESRDIIEKIKDIDLTAEIKIDNVSYLNGEIRDSSIYIKIANNGQIMILPATFKTPDGGEFRINGVYDNNSEIPKFIGKIDAKGESLKDFIDHFKIESQNLKSDNLKQYKLYCDILLLPNTAIFSNIYLDINNSVNQFFGSAEFSRDDKNLHQITINLRGPYFNVDDYFMTSGQNAYLSPGSFLKKILWLNSIISRYNIKLKFDKMLYNNKTFTDQSIGLKIGAGYFEISDMTLISDGTDLKANMIIDISGNSPKFNIRVFANKFNYKSNSIDNNLQINFIDKIFALPSLKSFDGIINLYFKEATIDGFKIDEAKIYGDLKDGSIKNSSIAGQLLGGDFKYEGLIGVRLLKIINGTILATNIELDKVIEKITGIKNIKAKGNLSAALTASASRKQDFLKNISAKIMINASNVEINNYGLNDLIKKMFIASIKNEWQGEPEDILFNKDNKTIFNEASGNIIISDENKGKFSIDLKATAVNSILSGSFSAKDRIANASFNSVFLTGNSKKQIPINIVTNLLYQKEKLSYITNLDQVRQYLGLPTLYSKEITENKKEEEKELDFSEDFKEINKN